MQDPKTYFEQVPLEAIRAGITNGEITGEEKLPEFLPTSQLVHTDGLQYPQWQRPLQEALLELNPEELLRRIALAEAAIAQRLASVLPDPTGDHERQALFDGLANLRVLKK